MYLYPIHISSINSHHKELSYNDWNPAQTYNLIFRGGGGRLGFFEKNSVFPYRSENNKMSSMKVKIKSLFFIQ